VKDDGALSSGGLANDQLSCWLAWLGQLCWLGWLLLFMSDAVRVSPRR